MRVDGERYPLRGGLKLIRGVRSTPVVDGGGLKQTLERRVFQRSEALRGLRFRKALVLVGVDRFGNVYGGVVRRQMLERHQPQSEQPTRGATW